MAIFSFGRITQFGYPGDPDHDSLTDAGISAIGKLGPASLAVSPDVEAKLRQRGIKIGTPVKLIFDDGSESTRVWDDRTLQDDHAARLKRKPLRNRVDVYNPGGFDKKIEGKAVVDIRPANQTEVVEPPLPVLDEKDELQNYAASLGFNDPLAPAGSNGPGDLGMRGAKPTGARADEGYIPPVENPTPAAAPLGSRDAPLSKPEGLKDWGKFAVLFGSSQKERASQDAAMRDTLNAATSITTNPAPAATSREARLNSALGLLPRTF